MGKRDKWVLLNVGGTYFLTTNQTLTRLTAPNSPLFCLSTNSTNVPFDRDDRGAFLIDRDPSYFTVVLNFLRHGHLLLTRDTTEEGVLIEAEYFNVPDLQRLLKQRIQNRTLNYLINQQQQQQQQQQQSSSGALINGHHHHHHQNATTSHASGQLNLIGPGANQLAAASTSAGPSLTSSSGISSGGSSSGSRNSSANAPGANTLGLFNSFGLGPIVGPSSGYSGLLEV